MSDVISSISDLVNQSRQLIDTFNGKSQGIDDAVQAAIAAVPEHTVTLYVDQVAGDDTADGKSTSKPVKSLSRAIALVGAGRMGEIRLLGDYTFEVWSIGLQKDQTIYLVGYNTKRKLILPVLPLPETDSHYSLFKYSVAGFGANNGSNMLLLNNLSLVFPSKPVDVDLAPAALYCALIGGSANSVGKTINVDLYSCDITFPTDGYGWIVGSANRATTLTVRYSTYPTNMAGHWIKDVAAGVAAPGKPYILTNLTTL